ncbi:hypothetical protein [Haliea salexigens]|uniref:hypothetical protein n=1 Tax=Haliea salexigens TaxID=287487 RepID=UPI00146E0B14|nr:hypothetical protein [Haliea salexigens]
MQHPADNRSLAPMRSAELRQQVGVIKDVLDHIMQKNVHYGVIPGCKEPSLYKPGAEKIMSAFRLSADPDITDLSDDDQIRYQVKVRLVSPSGHFVGAGIGECSSSEEKYKWRNAICKEEFDEAPSDRKREKWTRGYQGKPNFKKQQIRTEPSDLANTILKMAKKRALVDAVLTATAASDCFTQDIEDLPPEYLDPVEQPTNGRQPPAPYPDDQFAKNLPAWKKAIDDKKKTPDQIIAMIQSKAPLSDQQKNTIRNCAAKEGEIV